MPTGQPLKTPDITENSILRKLEGGDPRSMGQVLLVAGEVEANPARLAELFEGAAGPDRLVKLRAVQVIEIVTQDHPEYLEPYKAALLDVLAKGTERQYRRTLISLFIRLKLDEMDRAKVEGILYDYLADKTVTVVISALDALVELAGDVPERQVALLPTVERLTRTGTPYVRFCARKAQAILLESLTRLD